MTALAAGNTPISNLGQAPPVHALHMAITHGADRDAVNSIDKTHEPYLRNLAPAPGTASKAEVVATTAQHDRRSSPCSKA